MNRIPRLLLASTVSATLEGFLLPIARHFSEMGWRVEATASGVRASEACRDAFHATWEADWTRSPTDVGAVRQAARDVRTLVAGRDYDIVHVHTPVAGFVVRMALRELRHSVPFSVAYTAHGFHFHPLGNGASNGAFLALERLAGRWTDYLVVINDRDHRAALRHGLVPERDVVRMPGIGVEPAAYSPERVAPEEVERIRRELALPEGSVLLAMIAEFTPNKRQDVVVEALSRAGAPGLHVAMVGDGPRMEAVRRKAGRQDGGERVHFLGRRSDVPALLAASDATVLFSRREGLSRAVMESMCMERPVIGSDVRGIADLIGDGCGLLVPPDDVDSLAEAMRLVADRPDQAREMGRRGRARIERDYALDGVLRRHEELYERALRRARRRAGEAARAS